MLDNPQTDKVNVSINGAVLADMGTFMNTIEASVDGVAASASFQVDILDPCRRAIFQTKAAPISDMLLIRDFDTILTQTFSVLTDIELYYGIHCDYVASLVTSPSYVTLSGTKISADASLTTFADCGVKPVTVNVVSLLWPASVSSKSYTFNLTIQQCLATTMTLPSIANFAYAINSGLVQMSFNKAVWSNFACNYPDTYIYVVEQPPGSAIANPTWLGFDGAAREFSFDATN